MGDERSKCFAEEQATQDKDQDNAPVAVHDQGVDPFSHEEGQDPDAEQGYRENEPAAKFKPGKMAELDISASDVGVWYAISTHKFVTLCVLSKGDDVRLSVKVGSPRDPAKEPIKFDFPLKDYKIQRIFSHSDALLRISMISTMKVASGSPESYMFAVRQDGSYELLNIIDTGNREDTDPLNNAGVDVQSESGSVDGLRTGAVLNGVIFYEFGSNRIEIDHSLKNFKFLIKNKQNWKIIYDAQKMDQYNLNNIKVDDRGGVSVFVSKANGQKFKQFFHLKDSFTPHFEPVENPENEEMDEKTKIIVSSLKSKGIIINDPGNNISFNGAQEILNLINSAAPEIQNAVATYNIFIEVRSELLKDGSTQRIKLDKDDKDDGQARQVTIFLAARFNFNIDTSKDLTSVEKTIIHEIIHAFHVVMGRKIENDVIKWYDLLKSQPVLLEGEPQPPVFFKPNQKISAESLVTESFLGLFGGHPWDKVEEFIASFVTSARLVPERLIEVILWTDKKGYNVSSIYWDIWMYFFHKGLVGMPTIP